MQAGVVFGGSPAEPQDPQAVPAEPHASAVSEANGRQVPVTPPLQQPFGHEVLLQMQLPAVPSLEVSHTRLGAQPAQVAPAVPHDVLSSDAHGSQLPVGPPLQQPFEHDVESQTHWPVTLSHSSPVLQPPQVAPLAPHELLLSLARGSHEVPLQQPAQAPPPHEQTPLEQACAPPHEVQSAPLVPHELLDWPE